ncbi:MAG: AmmeMemoRadiSam system radical SAM enzyme [Marinilabilia sp.]
MKEALLYQKKEGNRVKCNLCAHRCNIKPGQEGICNVRENRDGVLYTAVYGRAIALHVDPVEKKPLYHFYPGSKSFSIGTPGCNFHCLFCQNCEIARITDKSILQAGRPASPEEVVQQAIQAGCKSIAYTYTEPTIFFEYSYDIASLAHEKNIKNVYVSNGYMTSEMLEMINPYLDAINIDLKAFNDATYKRLMGARLQPVLDNLKRVKKAGIWLEVTSLIIPGENDSDEELKEMAGFIANELGADVPWHISRFFPGHEMSDLSLTPLSTLQRAKKAGINAGLNYVYIGNVPSAAEINTKCPGCGTLLIERSGFGVLQNIIKEGRCPECGYEIAIR